jgi:hypothetical protein
MNCQNCQKPLLTVLTVTGVGIFAEIGPTIQIAAANTPPPITARFSAPPG